MKKIIIFLIFITNAFSLECECPLITGQEFGEEWHLVSQKELNKGTINKITTGFFEDSSKEDLKRNSIKIKSEYPKVDEEIKFIKTIRGDSPKRILYCSEKISVLPNGFEWKAYKKGRYRTNKYKIRTQETFIKMGCKYCKEKDKEYKYPSGFEENPEIYYENKCAEEKIGTKEECKKINGIIAVSYKDCCKEEVCFSCQKEDEDFEELLDDEEILFSWDSKEDLSEKCDEKNGKTEIRRKNCKETYRCVVDK